MAIVRGQNTQQMQLNIVGSSTFGRYPKISIEKTYNMFISDGFLVDYAGYKIAITSDLIGSGTQGRGLFTSTKLGLLVAVIDSKVFLVDIQWDQEDERPSVAEAFPIGNLETETGIVYITENNKPQILISDGLHLYIYDQTLSGTVQVVPFLNFTPGYITFHDTYFICAASNDLTYTPPANNTWRLSLSNNGFQDVTDPMNPVTAWPDTASYIGLIQSKPDNVQAVTRVPSKGNMIFVMGSIVTEAWFDTGAQLFPYQRNNQMNIDYGCLSPASVAYMDEIVVWLASNEKSGPVIMYSKGGMPQKITTDGIDFLFSELQSPEVSQGFLYRQDGHLFYHINFYSDNLSLFYDFNTDKFYHASDDRLNYFIASEISFIANQYYFVTRNSGNLYAFDTGFTTYEDVLTSDPTLPLIIKKNIIPRIRVCKNIRLPTQDYFIVNDIGFTIESGQTDYYQQNITAPDQFLLLDNTDFLLLDNSDFNLLSSSEDIAKETPIVFLSASYDGGAVFGSQWAYQLPAIGYRRNRLMWWQGGICNDFVAQFRFEGIGRFVVTDGIVNIRT